MAIRMATRGDIPQILDIYAPYIRNTAFTFEYTVPTPEEFTRRFDAITAWFPWLVWEENGRLLGYAYGSAPFERAAYQWCTEASVYLRPEAQGRGIAKALYRELEALLKAQGYIKVYALITSRNEASLAFHRAVGYRFTAELTDCGFKMGLWHGVVWMEKPLNPVEMTDKAPVSVHCIVKNNRNQS